MYNNPQRKHFFGDYYIQTAEKDEAEGRKVSQRLLCIVSLTGGIFN